MLKTFHFDLRHGANLNTTDEDELFLSIAGKRFPIERHTESTLSKIQNRAVSMIRDSSPGAVTHFCDFSTDEVPDREVVLMQVVTKIKGDPNYDLPEMHGFWYQLPERSKLLYAKRRIKGLAAPDGGGHLIHPKLAAYHREPEGLMQGLNLTSSAQLFSDADEFKTPYDTAVGILFQHPEMATSRGYTASIVQNDHIAPSPSIDAAQYNRVNDLALEISKQGPATKSSGWARITQDETPDGELMYAEFDLTDENGDVVYRKGDPMMTYRLTQQTETKIGSPVSNALRTTRDDLSLQNQLWSAPEGTTAETTIVPEGSTSQDALALRRASLGGSSATFTATNRTPHHGLEIYPETIDFRPGDNSFAMDVKNLYLRQLGSYVEFYLDTEMTQPIKDPNVNGSWPFYFPKELAEKFDTDTKRALGTVPNVNTILGIPMPTDPTNVKSPWPDDAQALKLMFGGLGTSNWINPVPWPGVILTGIFNYGIPLFFMAAGAAVTNTKFYKDFVSDTDKVVAAAGVGFGVVGGGVTTAAALGNTKKVLFSFASTIAGMLVKKGMEKLAAYITAKLVAAQLKSAVPIVGMAFRVAGIALDFAQIAVTTGECLSSPAVLEVDILRQMQLNFKLKPDPAHGEPSDPSTAIWPLVGDRVEVIIEYKNGTRFVQEQRLPATSSNTPLDFVFHPIGWGGVFQISANVYSKNGWLCGKFTSDEIKAEPDDPETGLKSIEANITELLVPLTGDTQYQHKQKLGYDKQSDEHKWYAGKPATATLADLNCSNTEPGLCEPVSITMNQAAYQAGYVYRASNQNIPLDDPNGPVNPGQMYVMQNISVLSDETLNKRLKFSSFGFAVQPALAYDTFGEGEGSTPEKKIVSQLNFVLDSRGGEYHLRHVDIEDGTHNFGLSSPDVKSWGRFYIPHLDTVVVHPSGYVLAASLQAGKLQVLKLPPAPVDDADAPEAQIVSGKGILQGLLNGPVAMKVAPNGAIYVLESVNRRVQAFDTKGNPVPNFPGAKLFEMPSSFAKDLDNGQFSSDLQQLFIENGLNLLGTFDDPEFRTVLDQGVLTQGVIDEFADIGIYLNYTEDEDGKIIPDQSSTVTVVDAGLLWHVYDPDKDFTYIVDYTTGELIVSDLLQKVTVEVVGQGQKWVVADLVAARSYLLNVSPKESSVIELFEYLSYFPLIKDAEVKYLDLALESKGYIYILSYADKDRTQVVNTDYRVDIYAPDGTFLVKTPDPKLYSDPAKMEYIAAARLSLDPWRNMFTLNYEAFAGPGGRVEPSIGTWTPTQPLFDTDPDKMDLFRNNDIAGVIALFGENGIEVSSSATIQTINADGDFILNDGEHKYNAIVSLDAKSQLRMFVYDIIS